MRKFLALILSLTLTTFVANAQMTDSQVVEYVQKGLKAGKSQTQIGTELMARGVTREQVERLRSQQDQTNKGTSINGDANIGTRMRKGTNMDTDSRVTTKKDKAKKDKEKKNVPGNKAETKTPIKPGKARIENPAIQWDEMFPEIDEWEVRDTTEEKSKIFGHSIFSERALSFEPNINAATPENYLLGPGDEVIIDIWGFNEATIRQTISPEGKIIISQVGPVQLGGLTIKQASSRIGKLLRSKYASLGASQSSVSVTLGEIRSIQVNIFGEVNTPGTYRLSSFSTVLNALYCAEGVNECGSMRNVKVVRTGEEIAQVDIYEYLFKGTSDSDISLKEGDVIIVPAYDCLVSVEGKVKRPMTYELRTGETLADLLTYCGGFASDAYRGDIRVTRQSGLEKEVFTVKESLYGSFRMDDGDAVEVGSAIDRFSNMVEVQGSVFRPGRYQIGGDIATLRQLVERAGGPTEDAFTGRAILIREKDDLSLENLSVNLKGILFGRESDVLLRKNDILVVSGLDEVEDRGTLSINGRVKNPGEYEFTDNMTVEDLILLAGGLIEGASTARVDVFRRSLDANSDSYSDVLGESFSFPRKEGLLLDGGDRFVLKPYDIVSVRRSPGYREGRTVTLNGEVLYPGTYMLQHDGETISDLIKRAGGLNPTAYVKGTTLMRKNELNDNELKGVLQMNKFSTSEADSLEIKKQIASDQYNVAIDLEYSMKNVHTNADMILKDGDIINVPALQNEVRVIGEVMRPASLSYEKGKPLRYYVKNAGGFSNDARRSHAYVIYPNGSAAKGLSASVEPGSTVVVPAKGERKGMSVGEIATVASASTSIVTALTLIANLVK